MIKNQIEIPDQPSSTEPEEVNLKEQQLLDILEINKTEFLSKIQNRLKICPSSNKKACSENIFQNIKVAILEFDDDQMLNVLNKDPKERQIYLHTIRRNKTVDYLSKCCNLRIPVDQLSSDFELSQCSAETDTSESIYEDIYLNELLDALVEVLTEDEFKLIDYLILDVDRLQIAEILGITDSALRKRIERLRLKLINENIWSDITGRDDF